MTNKSVFEKIKESLLLLDTTGKGINFSIKGQDTFKTYLGVVTTMVILFLTSIYGYLQYMQMIEYG